MPAAERTRFERHLKRCASCRIYLAQFRQTIAEGGRVTVEDVEALPEQARDELMQAFRAFHAER
jgi:anti-sigma factor RsiW